MPFTFKHLDIPDLILIQPKVFEDDRGFFMETYKSSDFYMNGIKYSFLQDNHSRSKKEFKGLRLSTQSKSYRKDL